MPSNSDTSEAQKLHGFPVVHLAAVAVVLLLILVIYAASGGDSATPAASQPSLSHDGSERLQEPEQQGHDAEPLELAADDEPTFYGLQPSWTLLGQLPPPAIPYQRLFAGYAQQQARVPYALRGQGPLRVRYDIKNGDTLTDIFALHNLGNRTVYQLLAADEDLLALDILRPGNHLVFKKSAKPSQLLEMELYIHPGHQVIYRRVADDSFESEEVLVPGEWRKKALAGQVHGSFYLSGISAGLSEAEIVQVGKLLEERLNFRRQLRAGDHFQVVRNSQYVDGEPTGQSHLEAIRIEQRSRVYTAFLHEDGMYYDEKGESLTRAFRRYPHDGRYRLSSHFNPRRRHPITGRISPHNGTDFAMPIGTPVVSIGDGVVTRVENHPFAGKYIEIKHGPTYKTRYLHLHRHLVRRGQSVKRGERIALSGNTGRSTGPHLHFEVHANNRPVNAMRVDLPMVAAIAGKDKDSFRAQVKDYVALMDRQKEQHLTMASTDGGRG